MEELFNRQNDIINEIQKIYNNFRKDSASRKTREYINIRVTALDNLWGEFTQNDSTLEDHRDENHEYFSKNVFIEFKKFYDNAREIISTFEVTPSEPKPNTSGADGGKFEFKPLSQLDDLLSQQRTNFRALQRLIDNINVSDISEKWEIEDELKNIQHRWHAIDELHLQIDNLQQGEDSVYDGEFRRMEARFKDMKRTLNRKIFSTKHAQLSVPQIDIPVFTGKYTQWPTFCDLFTETIHNNNCLTKTQKLQHLKSKIKGEAERLIQHLNISCDNYDTAWDLLVHRYNNPQVLFTKQIETFLNQPTLHKQTSYELRKLYDTTMECIHAIHNLGIDTTTWDPILVHLVGKKLDPDTFTDYKESRKKPRELPSFDELMAFIENKFIALEPLQKRERESSTSIKPFAPKPTQSRTNFQPKPMFKNYQTVMTFTKRCPYCSFEHDLYECKKFLNMSPEAKMRTINKLQICHNCLYQHKYKCTSTKRCKECNAAHNTILHDTITCVSSPSVNLSRANATAENENKATTSKSVNYVATQDEEVLLTTISLRVRGSDNNFITLRALLDQALSSIGFGSKQGKGVVSLQCKSIHDDYSFNTEALVIKHVISNLPNTTFPRQTWPHLQHLKLADPEYNISKPIDILLDASVYSDIILSGLIKGPSTAPIAQQTLLGWILSGNVKTFTCNVVLNKHADLSKYWEIEDIPDDSPLSQEDIYCEELFQTTTTRLEDGRYQVALPMKQDYQQNLGNSKPKALAQFMQIERKMSKEDQLRQGYQQFMSEYQQLGHMQEVTDYETHENRPVYYLPHHGVVKSDSTTTSLRVVFNASSKTSSGHSLNDLMYCGPNLQQDLMTLILKWRQHRYVMIADIEKMFPQIMVRDSDRDLQRILWRDLPRTLLKEYRLTTISYGMKAAPFLAMRVLKQIGTDYADTHPLAASELEHSFYMDDLMTGHNSIVTLKETQRQLITVLKAAGMNIRKWSSNEPELLSQLSTEQKDITHYEFKDSESQTEENKMDPELKAISDSISKLKEESSLNDQISYHDIHHYTVIYILFATVAAVGVGVTCRYIRHQRQWTRSAAEQQATPAPTPRPRHSTSEHQLDIPLPSTSAQLKSVHFKIPTFNESPL
ncbi:hypothetical protein ABMA28_002287 [Loxostege sticticalis]|uniref:Reverse transcriptase domain-containing protein n=1 Tax=Loxostege sticticalis TaxID=481309 RepID=A0ABD0T4L7_LOXSC